MSTHATILVHVEIGGSDKIGAQQDSGAPIHGYFTPTFAFYSLGKANTVNVPPSDV